MSNRFSLYLKLLHDIYGKKVVEKLTHIILNGGNKLYLKDFTSNLTELLFYKRSTDEGCSFCKMKNLFKEITLKNKTIYNHRIMEFPSWHPNFPLGFENESHAKKIMLIGEDPGPRIRSDLHTAYEFGMLNINPNGTYDCINFKKLLLATSVKHYISDFKTQLSASKRVRLWHYLCKLFNNKLENIIRHIYITDACKCNDNQNEVVWNECSSKYLQQEINLINPQLIIFQGNTAYDKFQEFAGNDLKEEKLPERYKFTTNFPRFGTYKNKIIFIKIFHTANTAVNFWNQFLEGYIELFKQKIIPTINLQIFY